MEVTSLARAGQVAGAVGGLLAVAVGLMTTVAVLLIAVRACRRPDHARLFAHLVEDLLEELGEGLCFAGAEEDQRAGLDLGRPVVGVGVEGIEEVFLDPARWTGKGALACVDAETSSRTCAKENERKRANVCGMEGEGGR